MQQRNAVENFNLRMQVDRSTTFDGGGCRRRCDKASIQGIVDNTYLQAADSGGKGGEVKESGGGGGVIAS